MQNYSFSPLRSPNKQKPKITMRPTPSPLRQRRQHSNLPYNVDQKNQRTKIRVNIISPTSNNKQNYFPQKENSFQVVKHSNMDNIKTSEQQQLSSAYFQIRSNSFLDDLENMSTRSKIQSSGSISDMNIKGIVYDKYKCQKCSKRKQSYLIVEDNMKYCSNCALEEMKNGKQVQNLKQLTENNINRTISPNFCSKAKQKCLDQQIYTKQPSSNKTQKQQLNPQTLLNKIEINTQRLKQKLSSLQKNLSQSSIQQKFSIKRQQLKKHYQKLKSTIQQAIKKDLQNLKKLEEIELLGVKHNKEILERDLKQLETIKKDVLLGVKSSSCKDVNNKQNDVFSINFSNNNSWFNSKQFENNFLQNANIKSSPKSSTYKQNQYQVSYESILQTSQQKLQTLLKNYKQNSSLSILSNQKSPQHYINQQSSYPNPTPKPYLYHPQHFTLTIQQSKPYNQQQKQTHFCTNHPKTTSTINTPLFSFQKM